MTQFLQSGFPTLGDPCLKTGLKTGLEITHDFSIHPGRFPRYLVNPGQATDTSDLSQNQATAIVSPPRP